MDSNVKTSRVSQWDLGFTIFASVLLANLLTLIIVFLYMNYEAKIAIEELNKITTEMKQESQLKMELMNKKAHVLQQQQVIKQERNNNAQRIRNKTCSFWTQQVQKENIERNRQMMQRACRR